MSHIELKNRKWYREGEHFIFLVILLNSIVIFLQACGYESMTFYALDAVFTLIFIVEMIVKHFVLGVKGYWRDGWNRMDGVLVLLSVPSLIAWAIPVMGADLSILLVLRLLRALRFFRLIHFFGDKGMKQLASGFARAMKASSAVLAAFFLIIVIFGLINSGLFGHVAPEFFGSPLRSIYSVFRLFTLEGWYEIPDSICKEGDAPLYLFAIRLYFSLLLIAGGIVGMSFINSVFVDAMTEDNNDDVKEQLRRLEDKVDELMKRLEEKEK